MVKNNELVNELKASQKELCDEFILQPEKVDRIMGSFMQKNKQFHDYTLHNLLLADQQLYNRTGERIELLAPYKRWAKINRNVKKGEKALYILAPIKKKIGIDDEDKSIYKTWFKRVPVFDISQTEGEPYNVDYTENKLELSFDEIKSRTDIPIELISENIRQGKTDGKIIWISENLSDTQKICTLFHEMAHYLLHFGEDRKKLRHDVKELEAESVCYMISSALKIKNDESSAYIKLWAGENSPDIIKGSGSKLIRVAQDIIKSMRLKELIETKTNLNKLSELREIATLNFYAFDECEHELKEINEELYKEAWENNVSSVEAWDYFENRLMEISKISS